MERIGVVQHEEMKHQLLSIHSSDIYNYIQCLSIQGFLNPPNYDFLAQIYAHWRFGEQELGNRTIVAETALTLSLILVSLWSKLRKQYYRVLGGLVANEGRECKP